MALDGNGGIITRVADNEFFEVRYKRAKRALARAKMSSRARISRERAQRYRGASEEMRANGRGEEIARFLPLD